MKKKSKPGDVIVLINRNRYPDGWNYYLTVMKFHGADFGWFVIDGAQKEPILSKKKADQVKKELIEKYKSS